MAAVESSSAATQAQLEVTERRLRPLYDALDYGHHKKALQLADKILKKQSDLNCAKVLKAIALLRLSRTEEAEELVEKVLTSHPGDQATLQALTLFYRETGDLQKIAAVYADAAKHYPKNQEILTHLFMAYVRVGNCQRQQQTAGQLCKAFPLNGPYQCWRVMSVLMQAEESGSAELVKSMFLPLADKLITKYFNEHTVDAEPEVRLYLMVLDKLGAMERKLQLLEESNGDRLKDPWERQCLTVNTLQSLSRWERAAVILTSMIESDPDSWFAITTYIRGQLNWSLALYKGNEETPANDPSQAIGKLQEGESPEKAALQEGETPSNSPQTGKSPDQQIPPTNSSPSNKEANQSESWLHPLVEACELLNRLTSDELKKYEAGGPCVRGPFLGRLELVKTAQQSKDPVIKLPIGSVCDLMTDYFRVFGSKNCVYDDLVSYLELSPEQVDKFLREVEAQSKAEGIEFDCPPDKIKRNLEKMRRHISLLQLQRHHGLHQLPLQRKQELVAMCLHHYRAGLALGSEFKDTASQPADCYIILAAHLKMELYHETGDPRHVWEGVAMLESVRNHNTQVALLLMKLYGHLGVAEAITDLHNKISIKHIQNDTLNYLPGRYLQSVGAFGFSNQLYRTAFRFYFQSSKEVSEHIIQCFKNGVFHKIPEMVEMRDRLTHSFNFAHTMVDMSVLELITTVNSYSEAVTFFQKEWSKSMPYKTSNLQDYASRLEDNRDFTVLEDWSPPSLQLSSVEIKITFELECLWLRTRICLLKCLHKTLSCLNTEEPFQTTEQKPPLELLHDQILELGGTVGSMDQHIGMMLLMQRSKQQLYPIQAPPPCLGYLFHTEGHSQLLIAMLGATHQLLCGVTSVRKDLENILSKLQAMKSRISGVSPDLREALIRIASPTKFDSDGDEGVEVTSPFEHPYDIITRSRITLEEYVLFVQTLSYLLLLCAVCAEYMAPSFTGGKKKKKRKATEQNRHPATDELVDFMKELMVLLTSTAQSFQPLPMADREEELVTQLKKLYISHSSATITGASYQETGDQDPYYKAWREGVARACGCAVSSYQMSFRDTLEVVTAKLGSFRVTIKQLGGHVD